MRVTLSVLLLTLSLCFASCSQAAPGGTAGPVDSADTRMSTQPEMKTNNGAPAGNPSAPEQTTVKLADASAAQNSSNAAVTRKVIKNAELSIEVSQIADAQRRIFSLAESKGGFVVSTDTQQNSASGPNAPYTSTRITLRVPATQFGPALDELRATGQVIHEKISTNDVTEEFIDLEARIISQKALEAQFIEIMKQAHTVSDALQVQRQLAEVRTDIERLQGRKRFLENQSDLSTIVITIAPPASFAVSPSGFLHNLRSAIGDGVDAALTIILFLVRVGIALLPIIVIVFLPTVLLYKYLINRWRRTRLARKLVQEEIGTASEG